MVQSDFHTFASDPFLYSLLKRLQRIAGSRAGIGVLEYNLSSIQKACNINTADPNPFVSALTLTNIMWNMKNIMQSMFISNITLYSNLAADDLIVSKTSTERQKNNRKRFNSRRFIKESSSESEMILGILQTLCLSIFRTFYDYDESTISQELYDYLFRKMHNLTF